MARGSNMMMSRRDSFWVSIAITLITLAAVVVLKTTALWADINGRIFDTLSTMSPATPENTDVVFVAIDEPSFSYMDIQWPWERIIHANLAKSLKEAGAKAIAFDIVFAESSNFEHDKSLGRAAGDMTVFASDETLLETPHATTLVRTEPIPDILAFGAKSGVASVALDGDGVVRKLPDYPDGFMRQLLNVSGDVSKNKITGERLIQYFGPGGSYPRVSYYQALNPTEFLPPDFFQDKVVIVGYGLQAVPDIKSESTDAFETPFTLRSGQLSYGAEVHATIFDNLKYGLSIYNPPYYVGILTLILGGVFGFFLSRLRRWGVKSFAGVGGVMVIVVAGWLALKLGRVWLSPLDMGAGFGAVMAVLAVRDFALEQKTRREIQGAFSQYLSPDMVDKIIADPTRLELGGEQKTLTIMFADIRGFTTLSEHFKDDPQGLTQLVNDILTPLADTVMAHGGTIDKFIGDCIMAFWNAPLDDPDHADHALNAARDMLGNLEGINQALASRLDHLPDVSVRIGIGLNTGTCVVGNMGSKSRFDYSVLGDAVNVASRLEGLSKTYDRAIIIGGDTYAALSETSTLTAIDELQVKGRAEPVTIYGTA